MKKNQISEKWEKGKNCYKSGREKLVFSRVLGEKAFPAKEHFRRRSISVKEAFLSAERFRQWSVFGEEAFPALQASIVEETDA